LEGQEKKNEKSQAKVSSLQVTDWTRDFPDTKLTNDIPRLYIAHTEAHRWTRFEDSSILTTYIRRSILMLSPPTSIFWKLPLYKTFSH
jgi:hypothetical protein